MQKYTIQIPADIYFEVNAENESAALASAEKVKADMVEATEFATSGDAYDARVYAHEHGEPSIEDIE
jgi:hypothetical protein